MSVASIVACSAGEKKAFTLKMTVGVTLAMIGFCMYSHTKLRKPAVRAGTEASSDLKSHKSSLEDVVLLPTLTPSSHTPAQQV